MNWIKIDSTKQMVDKVGGQKRNEIPFDQRNSANLQCKNLSPQMHREHLQTDL